MARSYPDMDLDGAPYVMRLHKLANKDLLVARLMFKLLLIIPIMPARLMERVANLSQQSLLRSAGNRSPGCR